MDTLAERIKSMVTRLYRERRFTQAALASELSVDPSTAHGYINGTTRISLDVLEAVAEVANIPVAELVAPPGSLVKQLDAEEATLLRYIRLWPKDVTRSLVAFLAVFADEKPAELQTRSHHEVWRRLKPNDRDWLHGVAVMMREGTLPLDLRGGLVEHLEAERNKRLTENAKKLRKGQAKGDA